MYLKLFLELAKVSQYLSSRAGFSFSVGSGVLTSRLSRFMLVLAPEGRS